MNLPGKTYDILVLGGGIVGLAFACAMARTGLSIGILEANQEVAWSPENDDLRVSAITLDTQKFFADLGIWPDMQAKRISPFSHMFVWDIAGKGAIKFDSFSLGLMDMGYIIENSVIQLTLQDKLKTYSNIDIIRSACTHWQWEDGKHQISTADDQHYQSALLIGADGKKSWLREQMNIPVTQHSYGQVAIVAKVKTTLSHQKTAWQRFLPTGPLAFLPLQSPTADVCSIVWSLKEQMATEIMALSDDDFCQRLAAAFDHKLGAVVETSRRLSFPLEKMHAQQYISTGMALIGDSAHCIHPLAGQGLNQGILDVKCLTEILKNALQEAMPLHSKKQLRRYERARRLENEVMLTLMDGFNHLFSNDNQVLSFLRNTGLSLTNQLPFLKSRMMQQV